MNALVVGRYAGTVEVLAALLRADGVVVAGAVAADRDGLPAVQDAVEDARRRGGAVVVTAAPGDPTRAIVCDGTPEQRVVAVVWHPADERPSLPQRVRLVEAGRISSTLAAVVRDVAAGPATAVNWS